MWGGSESIRPIFGPAREALSFVQGRTRSDLDRDRQLVLALVKDIEIVGEAAAQVTEAGSRKFPEIPWQPIVGMRNRVVHTYFDISLDVVWKTVQGDLPQLVVLLEKVIPPEPSSPPEARP